MSEWVVLGKVSGLFGLQGWVKLFSYTQPRAGIMDYEPLFLHVREQWREIELEHKRVQGKGLVAKLSGYDDRDAAAALIGCEIGVRRTQLPPLPPGEYYWADLEGLRVITVDGLELGRVERLLETGANDVLIVRGERERLIPLVEGRYVTRIDLEQGVMEVDWDPDF